MRVVNFSIVENTFLSGSFSISTNSLLCCEEMEKTEKEREMWWWWEKIKAEKKASKSPFT